MFEKDFLNAIIATEGAPEAIVNEAKARLDKLEARKTRETEKRNNRSAPQIASIIAALESNPEGLTASEIARTTKMTVPKVAGLCQKLKREKRIGVEKIVVDSSAVNRYSLIKES